MRSNVPSNSQRIADWEARQLNNLFVKFYRNGNQTWWVLDEISPYSVSYNIFSKKSKESLKEKFKRQKASFKDMINRQNKQPKQDYYKV